MKFQLWTDNNSSPKLVQLSEQYRIPLNDYASFETCKIVDVVDMANLNWKIILDEAFRSISREGYVEFKIKEYLPHDLRSLWLFLGQASYNRKCTLLGYEWAQGNLHSVRVGILRNVQADNSWSICYISDGKDIAQINQTADLVSANPNVEVLVSGPKDKLHGLNEKIVIVDDQHMVRTAMISAKKNMLIESAKNENILLLHDRYLVSGTFFSAFEDFGYDFSVAIPKQLYSRSLVEYPGLLVEENRKVRSVEQHVSRADFFVNGGCIAIKRDLARLIPLNSFLAWQEMEDIDWSERLIRNGEIPRLVRQAVVYTVGTAEVKTAAIKPIHFDPASADLFSEIESLATSHPIIFFTRLPDLISLYLEDSKYRRSLIARIGACRVTWHSLDPIHLTPRRFSFVLALSLFAKFGRSPCGISRRRILSKILSYAKDLYIESGFKVFLIIPGSLNLFFRNL